MKFLSLVCINSILSTILNWSKIVKFMEDFAAITALDHSGSFGKNFIKFMEKTGNVIYQPRSVRIGKNCALCLEYRPRPM